jgi:hypothetical protein
MGLIPFVSAIYYLQTYDFERGLSIFIHYSAIILSFIGAIIWGSNSSDKSPRLFYLSVTPSVFAFSAIFFDFPDILYVLALGYFIAWLIDVFLMIKNKEFFGYLAMRSIITSSVIYLHLYIV